MRRSERNKKKIVKSVGYEIIEKKRKNKVRIRKGLGKCSLTNYKRSKRYTGAAESGKTVAKVNVICPAPNKLNFNEDVPASTKFRL
jgi:hypothetical protein